MVNSKECQGGWEGFANTLHQKQTRPLMLWQNIQVANRQDILSHEAKC